MIRWIRKTNSEYDALQHSKPALRFLIFIAPLVIAGLLDIILTLTGIFPGCNFVMFSTIGIMALWRISGSFLH